MGFKFGFESKKSPIEHIFEAYKIGDFPFALFCLGLLCMISPLGLEHTEIGKEIFEPTTLLIVGGTFVIASAIMWSVASHERTKSQIAILHFLEAVSATAASGKLDGANFHMALSSFDDVLERFLNLKVSKID